MVWKFVHRFQEPIDTSQGLNPIFTHWAIKAVDILSLPAHNFQAKTIALSKLKKENRHLKHEYKTLEERFACVRLERNEIKERFSAALFSVHKKMSVPADELEAKLDSMSDIDKRPKEIQVWTRLENILNGVDGVVMEK